MGEQASNKRVIWRLLKLQGPNVGQDLSELRRVPEKVASHIMLDELLLTLTDSLKPPMFVPIPPQPLPRQCAKNQVHNYIEVAFQVISPTLLQPHMVVNRGVTHCPS
jgi:hypothetical protein